MKMADLNRILWVVMGLAFHEHLSAIAEQFNDENGLVWPINIAPYDIHVIPVNMKNEHQAALAENYISF